MDKNRVKGTIKQAAGNAKKSLGKITGDTSLEVEGEIEQAEGTAQKAYGKAKDALRKL